jgi:apolipoprotein N-acyltransferase
LVRCANTGISATFEASGRQKGLLPLNEAGFLSSEVHPLQVQTFYAAWGDVFAWLCVLVTLLGLGLTIHRRER